MSLVDDLDLSGEWPVAASTYQMGRVALAVQDQTERKELTEPDRTIQQHACAEHAAKCNGEPQALRQWFRG